MSPDVIKLQNHSLMSFQSCCLKAMELLAVNHSSDGQILRTQFIVGNAFFDEIWWSKISELLVFLNNQVWN